MPMCFAKMSLLSKRKRQLISLMFQRKYLIEFKNITENQHVMAISQPPKKTKESTCTMPCISANTSYRSLEAA